VQYVDGKEKEKKKGRENKYVCACGMAETTPAIPATPAQHSVGCCVAIGGPMVPSGALTPARFISTRPRYRQTEKTGGRPVTAAWT